MVCVRVCVCVSMFVHVSLCVYYTCTPLSQVLTPGKVLDSLLDKIFGSGLFNTVLLLSTNHLSQNYYKFIEQLRSRTVAE